MMENEVELRHVDLDDTEHESSIYIKVEPMDEEDFCDVSENIGEHSRVEATSSPIEVVQPTEDDLTGATATMESETGSSICIRVEATDEAGSPSDVSGNSTGGSELDGYYTVTIKAEPADEDAIDSTKQGANRLTDSATDIRADSRLSPSEAERRHQGEGRLQATDGNYTHPTTEENNRGLSSSRERRHKCRYCKKRFTEKRHLKTHKLIHKGIRPFPCSYCDKAYVQRGHLKQHELTHTGERPHQCSFCEKTFVRRGVLKRHEFLHTGQRPHQCGFCEKTFTEKGNLKQHERTHRDAKPYQCSYCGEWYSHLRTLKLHMYQHTGDMPFTCGRCGKGFARRNDLERHGRAHEGTRLHQCGQCERTFSRKVYLTKHELTHNPTLDLLQEGRSEEM